MKLSQTQKRLKYIGQEPRINFETGVIEDIKVSIDQEVDVRFYKIWLDNLMPALCELGDKGIRFCFWLLKAANKQNQVHLTMKVMRIKSKCSLSTVQRSLKVMTKHNIIYRETKFTIINPDVLFQGSHANRMQVKFEYQQLQAKATINKSTEIKELPETEIFTKETLTNKQIT